MNKTTKIILRAIRHGDICKTLLVFLRKRSRNVLVFPNVHVCFARSSKLAGAGCLDLGLRWQGFRYMASEFSLAPEATLNILGDFRIYTGFHIGVNEGATLTLGSGYINCNATIDCYKSITIGRNCCIAKGVTIRDSDNHAINGSVETSAPIVIEDNVWIGLNATILKGVRIGKGSVVAAGAVVVNDVPAGTLVGGVPSRIIKENICWS